MNNPPVSIRKILCAREMGCDMPPVLGHFTAGLVELSDGTTDLVFAYTLYSITPIVGRVPTEVVWQAAPKGEHRG